MNVSETVVTLARRHIRRFPSHLAAAPGLADALNAHLREHPRRRVVPSRFGTLHAVDTQDLIQRYLYLFGVWEPHLTRWLRRRLGPGDTFVDVGANLGYYSLLASGLVGARGRVVAIEASADFHARLRANLRLNDRTNVRAVHAAVSDAPRTLRFVLASSRNTGANSIVPYDGPAESSFEIEARPLPQLLTAREIERARVIKIDVEGAEGGVLRGMLPVLPRLRTDAEITVEITPERMARLGDRAEELVAAMADHGYHAYRIANDYRPRAYVRALNGEVHAPVRLRSPLTEESDVVFSRVDADTLG